MMKTVSQRLTCFLACTIAICLSAAQTWEVPSLPASKGIPPENTEIYLYNVKQKMFLTKGTTWGTHAALTENVSSALVYKLFSESGIYQLHADNGGGQGYLFCSNNDGDVYCDYGVTSNPISYTYWDLKTQTNGSFRISIAKTNGFYNSLPGYCVGWNPSNSDKSNDGTNLYTNVGIFALSANNSSYGLDWYYYTADDIKKYSLRQTLYNLLLEATDLGVNTSDAGTVYNNSQSTSNELQEALFALQALINEKKGEEVKIDMTNYIVNPNFNGNVNGWTVNAPRAQNKGFQGATRTNGSIVMSQFAEAWLASPGTLGECSISQVISDLPKGVYTMEADIVSVYQGSDSYGEGVYLFADGEAKWQEPVYSHNYAPEHFSLTFVCEGGNQTIGIRTLETTNANWIAIDNVALYYCGAPKSTATAVSVTPRTLSLIPGESGSLKSTVSAADALYAHAVWSSSNPAIATVDNNGNVLAISEGKATITARAIGGTKSATSTVTVKANQPADLVINEIQVANIDMFIDPSFNYGGWVEFYNPSSSRISLGNLYLSDTPDNLKKFQLPIDAGIVNAGGFANVWFDHHSTDDSQSDEAYKQVDFKLNYEGGTLYVSDSNGNLLLTQTYPAAITRTSYARTSDGGISWGLTANPTPAASNSSSTFASLQLAAPVVDRDATVFTQSFKVNVTIPSGATLRYTTDGSTPTLTNGATSNNGTFSVNSGTTRVLRFRLYKDGYLPSPVVTRSYIYNDKNYYLPIISVVTERKNLYDNQIGAYVDGTNGTSGNNKSSSNKNRSWERPVNFEYLIPDENGNYNTVAVNQEVDFEVCGGWSRHFAPAASFRLKGAKQYEGNNFIPYSVFADKPYIKNKTLQVRNGGNDNLSRIRDAAIHEIIIQSGFYVDAQSCQPAHVFINGEYQFMFNIREPNNKNFGYSNYGIDTDEMDQFEVNGSVGYEQKTGDDVMLRQWMSLAADLAKNPADESIYNSICDIVDVDEYCNYMAVECYVGSSDWLTNCNNVKGFRERTEKGKFHMVFMDVDAGFGSTDMLNSLPNHLYDSRYDTGKSFMIDIFLNMLQNTTFRKKFIDAFCIVNGSVFTPERVTEIVNQMAQKTETALGFEGNSPWSSANSLISAINSTSNRNARMSNMSNYFGLGSGYQVSLRTNVEQGAMLLNGNEIPLNSFDGTLFAPATITVQAPAGFAFKGWGSSDANVAGETVFSTSDSWKYYDKGSLDGRDWKSLTYNESSWSTGNGPFGYGNVGTKGSADYQTTISYGTNSNNKRPTYYFRKTIVLDSAPTDNDTYVLSYDVDDGFIAYLNGVEIGRYHMADGNATYSQYSTTYEGATAAHGTIVIDNSLFTAGNNVFAVEVHNTSATSSDIYWGASLKHSTTSSTSIFSNNESITLADLSAQNIHSVVAVYERMEDSERMADLASAVRVNEVSAGNTVFINDSFKKNDWFELYNTTDTDLDIAGLYVSDDMADPMKYQIPSYSGLLNTVIPAGGHLIVWADKLSPTTQLHTNFKLGNSDGETVVLTSSDEFVNNNADFFAAHPSLKSFADAIVYKAHEGNQSVGRYPDGSNTFYLMSRPTIEKKNSLLSFDEIVGFDKGTKDNTDATFTLDMAEGWNWMSHPLTEPLSVSLFKDHATRVLSQTQEAYYSNESRTMRGSLKSLSAGQLYKMQIKNAHTYQFDGQISATLPPAVLHQGWNWIGYPTTGMQALAAVFGDSPVEEGDMIVGQNGFSVYSKESGWTGTLSTLVAGNGYMYKSASAKSLRFSTPAAAVTINRPVSRRQSVGGYTADRHAHPDVMGIIARLTADGTSLNAENFTLIALSNGECRGISKSVNGRLFLSVYGDGNERLTFMVMDEDGVEYAVAENMVFTEGIVGSLNAPITFSLTKDEMTGIAAINGLAEPVGFYNLNGQFLGNNKSALTRGIVIVRYSNGVCRKVFIH